MNTAPSREGETPSFRRWIDLALIVPLFVGLAANSWRRWADPVVDYGMQLYMPWRISEGEVLYRDIAWKSGPLSAYVHAWWFELVGASYGALIASGLVGAAIAAWLIRAFFVKHTGMMGGARAALLFVGVFVFSQLLPTGNYNWISPYTHEVVHGTALIIGMMVLLARWCETGGRTDLLIASLLLGLSFLTKIECFLAGAAGMLVALIFSKRFSRRELPLVGIAGAPPLMALLLLTMAMPFATALHGVGGNFFYALESDPLSQGVYRATMGLDDPAGHFSRTAVVLVGWAVVLAGAFVVDRALGEKGDGRVALIVAGVTVLVGSQLQLPWPAFTRPLPLVLVAILVVVMRSEQRSPALLGWTAMSLVLLLKVLFRCTTDHYGFVLCAPGAVLCAAFIPGWIRKRSEQSGGKGNIVVAFSSGVLMLVVAGHVGLSSAWYSKRVVKLGEGANELLVPDRPRDPRGIALEQARVDLAQMMKPGETLLVLPEGILLNVLVGARSPLPYLGYTPYDLVTWGGEADVLHQLGNAKPTYVAVLSRDVSECGLPDFGHSEQYGGAMARWILSHGEEVWQFAADPLASDQFGMAIWRMKNDG